MFGDPPVCNGGRSDRNEVYKLLKSGATDVQIMDHDFSQYNRFIKGIDRFRAVTKPTIREGYTPPEVYIYFGPPGTGKSEHVQTLHPDVVATPLGKDFWLTDDFVGAEYVLIEEFKRNLQLSDLLRLFDRYPCQVPRKGGFIWWYPKKIFVTTNKRPSEWFVWNGRDHEMQALFRRITAVYRFWKNEERVPRPQLIDINVERHFEDDYIIGEEPPVTGPLYHWNTTAQQFQCVQCKKMHCECL